MEPLLGGGELRLHVRDTLRDQILWTVRGTRAWSASTARASAAIAAARASSTARLCVAISVLRDRSRARAWSSRSAVLACDDATPATTAEAARTSASARLRALRTDMHVYRPFGEAG